MLSVLKKTQQKYALRLPDKSVKLRSIYLQEYFKNYNLCEDIALYKNIQ